MEYQLIAIQYNKNGKKITSSYERLFEKLEDAMLAIESIKDFGYLNYKLMYNGSVLNSNYKD